jgi:TonB family protein
MNRKLRIIGGCSIALGLLMFLSSCATTSGPRVPLETVRNTLQTQYPDLLRSFDLHQGIFSVADNAWDALEPATRTEFLDRCSQARHEITGRKDVRILEDSDVVASYDGSVTVLYGAPSVAAAEQDMTPSVDSTSGQPATPVLLSIPRPIYPPAAYQAGIEGTVVVQARIGADGMVKEIVLVSGGISMLNPSAVAAARKARFRPFVETAASEPVWVQIPLHFSILGSGRRADHQAPDNAGGLVDAVMTRDTAHTQQLEAQK